MEQVLAEMVMGGNGGVINNRPGGEDTDIDDIKR